MEQKQNIITKDELIPSDPTCHKPTLAEDLLSLSERDCPTKGCVMSDVILKTKKIMSELSKNPHNSFFNNNVIFPRENESGVPYRQVGNGLFSLHMDSYLIIPLEKMNKEELTKLGYSHLFQ